eukprot:scaffold1747_cov108-Isochrysis_galbana.AAC.14
MVGTRAGPGGGYAACVEPAHYQAARLARHAGVGHVRALGALLPTREPSQHRRGSHSHHAARDGGGARRRRARNQAGRGRHRVEVRRELAHSGDGCGHMLDARPGEARCLELAGKSSTIGTWPPPEARCGGRGSWQLSLELQRICSPAQPTIAPWLCATAIAQSVDPSPINPDDICFTVGCLDEKAAATWSPDGGALEGP